MAVKYLAGERIIGTAAERAALTTSTESQGANTSWKQVGRIRVQGGAVTNMTTGTFTPKDNYVILCDSIMSSTADQTLFRFGYNNITDNQTGLYSRRSSLNGASSSSDTGEDHAWINVNGESSDREFSIAKIKDDGGTDSYPNGYNWAANFGGATDLSLIHI